MRTSFLGKLGVVVLLSTAFVGSYTNVRAESIESNETSTDKNIVSNSLERITAANDLVGKTNESTTSNSASFTQSTSEKEEERSSQTQEEKTQAAPILGRALGEQVTAVSTWAELVAAYNNSATEKIVFTKDIDGSSAAAGALYNRSTSIDIDGQGHALSMGNARFLIRYSASNVTFNLKNISNLSSKANRVQGIVDEGVDAAIVNSGWTINMSNITSATDMQTRIASAPGAQLNLSGNIYWYTATEMAVITGVKIEENARVTSLKQSSHDDRSFFWFPNSGFQGVGSGDFVVGKNAVANFKMLGSGTAFPVVFAYYKNLHLEEGATFNGTMPGNAFRSDYYASNFIADGSNKINLTSLSSGYSPVDFYSGAQSSQPAYFTVGPQSELYVIGATNQPLFNGRSATDARRRSITIDSPANYDLRNYSNTTGNGAAVATSNLKQFQILNSDVSVWKNTSSVTSGADFSATMVQNLTQNSSGNVTSDNAALASMFKTQTVRRVSGLNQKPQIEFPAITDADLTIKARVIVGYVPDDNGIDENGNFQYIPQYAGEKQVTVKMTDTYGTIHDGLLTNKEGYVSYTDTKFNLAQKNILATANRGGWVSEKEASTTILDVTPPEPAVVDNENQISSVTTTLTGTAEPNSTLTVALNGKLLTNAETTVGNDGRWSLAVPTNTLKKGDVLQLFLQDHSGALVDLTDRPTTNNDIGNIEPSTDYRYRDAVFKAAKTVSVNGVLALSEVPSVLDFGVQKVKTTAQSYWATLQGNLAVSDTRGAEKKTWRVILKQAIPLQNGNTSLEENLYFVDGSNKSQVTSQGIEVERQKLAADGTYIVNSTWKQGTKGLELIVPVEKQKIGSYHGTLEWSLQDVPGNE